MIERIAGVVLGGFVAVLAIYAYARLTIRWRNRRPPVVHIDAIKPVWEYSDRERR